MTKPIQPIGVARAMGNPNRLISLLPPKVRQAVQAQMDLEAVADLFGLTKEELEMEAKTPKITKAAAREIWKAACNTKSVLTPFEIYERLIYVLQKLSNDVGEDGEPLGLFLSDQRPSRLELPAIQQFAIEKGCELNRSIYTLSCLGKAWLTNVGRLGLEKRIDEVQKQLDSIFDEIRSHADDLGFPLNSSTPREDAAKHQH